jgi:hypothetical protein
VEPWYAVHTVPIEQSEGRIPKFYGTLNQRLGERGSLEKAERGGGMKLDVRHEAPFRERQDGQECQDGQDVGQVARLPGPNLPAIPV